ncbi:hypothetical protein Cantr_08866 [Candida viswanathii]|uniref:Mitochondrial resolvase Ydc2 catalytic domain-containing protein n=1 Tax=Candida viswanathii TaxID=5486 RepID=A0A367Y9E5_9ASCO|nr:hypothetical protein Cantr_08866 [Candida viswanathii]
MMEKSSLVKKLLSYKVSTLSRLAILCGVAVPSVPKATRIQWIIDNYRFYLNNYHNHLPRSVLGIDIGVKNFSYCKSTRPLDKSFPIRITEWSKVNLDEMFGKNYEPLLNRDSQIDAKRYFQFITRALLEHLEPHKSDVVVMEAQRTRSIGNTSTLPSVMQCYTLENLIVGNTYPRIVIPMTAFQMMNYWVHRFFGKSTVKSVTKNQKAIRFDLLSTWKDVLFELPGYGGAELEKKQVLEYLKLEKGEKVDDLMDSLLYNITINSQFQNLRELHELMSTDLAGCDLERFVDDKDAYHLELLEPIMDKYKLK